MCGAEVKSPAVNQVTGTDLNHVIIVVRPDGIFVYSVCIDVKCGAGGNAPAYVAVKIHVFPRCIRRADSGLNGVSSVAPRAGCYAAKRGLRIDKQAKCG